MIDIYLRRNLDKALWIARQLGEKAMRFELLSYEGVYTLRVRAAHEQQVRMALARFELEQMREGN